MNGSISVIAAFAGGALSFLAPCVLPLVPGYLSFVTGVSVSEMRSGRASTGATLVPSALFVAGFTTVFVLLGAAAGFASETLGSFVAEHKRTLAVISGLAVIGFGVLLMDVIKVPWLYREVRADLSRSRRFGRAAALAMGVAFGFGWTPCVGPILAVILGMAAQTGDSLRAAVLLLAYSLGLGVPFLVTAALFGRVEGLLKSFSRHSLMISRVSGGVLVVMGLLIATGSLGRLSALLVRLFPFFGSIG
ncbi:MAG: cytochrome c biogenesis protein CcdA [Coriobacteriia bacterium]|nr:cytochrome c biogenesis protein CcdA [Coriobacteriia bacterium]